MRPCTIPDNMADAPNRKRPTRAITSDSGIIEDAMRVAAQQRPPIANLSRLIDVALAQWADRNRPPIQPGRKVKPPAKRPRT